jgi:hypothetical protein
VTFAHGDEGSVEERLLENLLLLELNELLEAVSHEVHVSTDVFWEEQSILPDSVAFMSPHADKAHRVGFV